jgi:hypothetical protein
MNRRNQRDPLKEQFWRHTFRDWKASELSRKQFCAQRRLNPNTFQYWRHQIALRDRQQAPSSSTPQTKSSPPSKHSSSFDSATTGNNPSPTLVPLRIVGTTPIEVCLSNGRVLRVPVGFDPKHLRILLEVLEPTRC